MMRFKRQNNFLEIDRFPSISLNPVQKALNCVEKACVLTGSATIGKKNVPGSNWGIGVAVFIVLAIIAAIAAAIILRKCRARVMPVQSRVLSLKISSR